MEPQLTTKEAYAAMYLFLEELFMKFGYDQLGGLLGGMSLLEDGSPADAAIWQDWLRVVDKAKTQQSDITLRLNSEQEQAPDRNA